MSTSVFTLLPIELLLYILCVSWLLSQHIENLRSVRGFYKFLKNMKYFPTVAAPYTVWVKWHLFSEFKCAPAYDLLLYCAFTQIQITLEFLLFKANISSWQAYWVASYNELRVKPACVPRVWWANFYWLFLWETPTSNVSDLWCS